MASKDFAFTQLLRAYRKGIISEALFEQQMNELTASKGAAENPLNISNVMAFRGDGTKARGKRLQRTEQSETMTFTIPPNFHSDRENSHRGDQIIYVLEGSATARVAGIEQQIKAGDILTIPAGAMHTLRTDSEPLFGLTVFAPPEPA